MLPKNYPRFAIVTGADSGIGRATAELLATEGFDVGITAHDDIDGARATAKTFVEKLDASSERAGDVVDALAAQLGGLGVLVNVAGTGHSTKVIDLGYDEWRHVIATDLDGPFLLSQHAARHLIDGGAGGRIINVTSVHEHLPRLGAAAYCAAKAGLGLFSKVLALELGEHGITVNTVAPGEIATAMTGIDEADAYDEDRPGNPLGRPGHVNEIASMIAYLASPRSGYTTGATLTVDGGLQLMAAHGHDHATSWRNP
jgi:NAD(P)-dependent dehydrogenase (short-subunit alcohol dehydrogenase family)